MDYVLVLKIAFHIIATSGLFMLCLLPLVDITRDIIHSHRAAQSPVDLRADNDNS